jgi:hypothetical protein
MLDDEFDATDGYLLHETVCACHHLAYNVHLGACPIAVADSPSPWSPR